MNQFLRKYPALLTWFACMMVLPQAIRGVPQAGISSTGTLVGTVSDSSGARLAGAEVRIRSLTADFARTAAADENGAFHIDELPFGTYELFIRFAGLIPVSQRVSLNGGVLKPLQFTLAPDVLKQTVTVTEGRNEEYEVATASSATRLDAPIMDIPQSIQAVSKGVLQDRQVTHVADAAEVVSGVTRTIGFSDIADRYVIRGFLVDYTLKDGFKNNNFVTLTDAANVERVEVLKGPSGILYGKIEPGGVVNVVTKRPLSDWHFAVQSVFDGFGSVRASTDATGSLNRSKTVLGRMSGAFDEARSARDFAKSEAPFVAPALTWIITKKTIVSLEGEYLHLHGVPDAGVPPDAISFSLPVNRTIGEPSDVFRNENDRGSLLLTHEFGNNWMLTGGLSLLNVNAVLAQIRSNLNQPVTGNNANRGWVQFNQHSQDDAGRIEISGKLRTGFIRHTLLTGFELARDPLAFALNLSASGPAIPSVIPPLDLFHPVYGQMPSTIGLNRNPANEFFFQRENSGAAYMQDQIAVSCLWKILVGGRYDLAKTTRTTHVILPSLPPSTGPDGGPSSSRQPNFGPVILRNRLSHFSPHGGIVFQPTSSISAYFSYSQSFQFLPFNPLLLNLQLAGAPSAATRGRQYEGGIKLDTLGNRVQATISYFRLVKDGLPNASNSGAQTESQISKGVEVDVVGQLARRWNILAAYAYDRNSGTVHYPILNAPLQSGNVWTTYRVDQGRLHNVIVGAGANYVDWRQANPLNGALGNGGNFQLPPYTRLDAMLAYEIKENHWRLQVNVKDLTGREYYQTDAVFAIVYPAARTVQASIRYQF